MADSIQEGELKELEKEVSIRIKDLLRSLIIDIDNDHNTREISERVGRMYINEVFKGRYHK